MTPLALHLRQDAIDFFTAGLAAADPEKAVRAHLSYQSQQLRIKTLSNHTSHQRSENWSKVHLIALGKAACKMAISAQQIIPPSLFSTDHIVITNYENMEPSAHLNIIGAGHPTPCSPANTFPASLSRTQAGKQRVLGSNPSSKPLHWLRNYTGELWTGPAQLKQILSFHASAFPLSSAFGEAFSAMTYSP